MMKKIKFALAAVVAMSALALSVNEASACHHGGYGHHHNGDSHHHGRGCCGN